MKRATNALLGRFGVATIPPEQMVNQVGCQHWPVFTRNRDRLATASKT